ncbi:MAG TPA: LTA synthase family protein [Pseudobacteroides sp.]|uniref:LTA synthase family protein n=1 Tax=Pseudobacteroides sp. TaxID=1968840 RepID=UPI002F955DF6
MRVIFNIARIGRWLTDFTLKEIFFLYTFLAIAFKSTVFLGYVKGPDHWKFNIIEGFFSIYFPLYFVFFILAILVGCFLFRGIGRIIYLFMTNLAVTILFVVDVLYFRAFDKFVTPHLLKEITNLDNLSGSIISFFSVWDLILIMDIPIMLLGILWFRKRLSGFRIRPGIFAVMFLISVGYLVHIPFKVNVLGIKDRNAFIFDVTWRPDITFKRLSPIGYHINDLIVYYNDCKTVKLSTKQIREIKDWFKEKNENLPDNKYAAMFKGKNLIYIQVESLENFVLGREVYGQEITPNLNRIIKNSIFFTHIEEQVNMGTSSDADFMVNTSVYPVRRGSTFFRYPGNTYNSMPVLLGKVGYSTLAIHPDKGSYWNWMNALKSIGFQKCIDSTEFVQDDFIGLGLSDESFLKQVKPIVLKQKQPFYIFMVTLSSHAPFNLPKKYESMSIPEDINKTRIGGYFQSVHYADRQIGHFLSELDSAGALENTVVAIGGDHCGVHKFYKNDIINMKKKESWWSENYNYIPFMVYSKGYKGETIGIRGGQIDVMPTLLNLMGVGKKEYLNSAMGRNLLNTKKSFAVLANGNRVGNIDADEKQKRDEIKGLEIADTIIRSNFFNTYK